MYAREHNDIMSLYTQAYCIYINTYGTDLSGQLDPFPTAIYCAKYMVIAEGKQHNDVL